MFLTPLTVKCVSKENLQPAGCVQCQEGSFHLEPICLLSSRVLGFCCRPDGQCGQWHSPLVASCLSILVDFLHDRADMWHSERSAEQAGTFSAMSVPCSMRTGGSSLMVGSGKVLLQTESLRHTKCVLVSANEHRIWVWHLRTLGCTQCLVQIQWRWSLPLSLSLSLTSCFWSQSLSKVASHSTLALSWFPHAAYSCICWKAPTCSAKFISLLVHHVFDPIAVGQPGVLIISLQGLAGAVGLLGCLAVLTLGWRAGVAALSVAAPSQRSIRLPFLYIHGTLVWVLNIKIMTSVWRSDWNNLKERIKKWHAFGHSMANLPSLYILTLKKRDVT